MQPDFAILKAAYLMPLQNLDRVLKVFWPFMLSYGLADTFDRLLPDSFPFPALFYVLAILLFASCAVNWHRWLVLDETDALAHDDFRARRNAYLVRMALIMLATLLPGFIAYFLAAALTDDMDPKLPDRIAIATVVTICFDFLACLIFARWMLGLPVLAAERLSEAKPLTGRLLPPDWPCRTTFLAASLPSLIVSLAGVTYKAQTEPSPAAAATSIWREIVGSLPGDIGTFYGALVFLSALSLWYKKYERPRLVGGAAAKVQI